MINKIIPLLQSASNKALSWKAEYKIGEAEYKSDGTPVTVVDQKLNDFIIENLAKLFPEDDVVGEESYGAVDQLKAKRIWYVDPIDGTKEFVKGTGQWSIMLGAIEGSEVVLSVVVDAEKGQLFWAAPGEGTWQRDLKTGAAVRLYMDQQLQNKALVSSKSAVDPYVKPLVEKIGIQHNFQYGSIGLKISKMLQGEAQFYVNSFGWCSYWDLIPCELLVSEGGGVMLDFNLQPLSYPIVEDFKMEKKFFVCSEEAFNVYKKDFEEIFSEN